MMNIDYINRKTARIAKRMGISPEADLTAINEWAQARCDDQPGAHDEVLVDQQGHVLGHGDLERMPDGNRYYVTEGTRRQYGIDVREESMAESAIAGRLGRPVRHIRVSDYQ